MQGPLFYRFSAHKKGPDTKFSLYKMGLPNLARQSPNLLNLESDVALAPTVKVQNTMFTV